MLLDEQRFRGYAIIARKESLPCALIGIPTS